MVYVSRENCAFMYLKFFQWIFVTLYFRASKTFRYYISGLNVVGGHLNAFEITWSKIRVFWVESLHFVVERTTWLYPTEFWFRIQMYIQKNPWASGTVVTVVLWKLKQPLCWNLAENAPSGYCIRRRDLRSSRLHEHCMVLTLYYIFYKIQLPPKATDNLSLVWTKTSLQAARVIPLKNMVFFVVRSWILFSMLTGQ